MTLIIDSHAWVELFSGTPRGQIVKDRLEGEVRVVTPDVALAELGRKFIRDGVPQPRVRSLLRSIVLVSELCPINIEVAMMVPEADADLRSRAKARGHRAPGLADAVILATARCLNGQVLTADPHFEGLEETTWLDA